MNKSLPERPDVGQLKKQAKDLLNNVRAGAPEALARIAGEDPATLRLADAQRIVAREYGFPSWAKLKLHVETREIGVATARLVIAAAHGDAPTVNALLAERPALARQTVSACAVLGDLGGLRAWIAKDAKFATARGGIGDAEALAYVCLGRVGGDESARVACARFLLAHGADPNATWRENPHGDERLPILYGATGRNNYPKLARDLLAAGADPNDGESVYHAAENNHVGCLEALVAAGADISRRDPKWTNTPLYFLLGGQPGTAQADSIRAGVVWLLDHGADPNITAYQVEEVPLFPAIRNGWDLALIELFLKRGANPNARRADGCSLFSVAARAGCEDVMRLLRDHGATGEVSPQEQFLGALASGRAAEARAAISGHGDWRAELAADVGSIVVEAAKKGRSGIIELAVALGFDVDRPGGGGERPIHWAAWHGRAGAVQALISAGADLDQPDTNFHAPPFGWCMHGSLNCRSTTGDYAGAAEVLAAAGARLVWSGAASPEVMAVVKRYSAGKTT